MDNESIESLWSNILNDSGAPLLSDTFFSWNFQMIQTHLQIAQAYFGFGALEVAMRDVEVIETPYVLFQRHLTTFPIDQTKALDVARLRIGETEISTIFEDPVRFYKYNTAGLIIAEKPTDCYKVIGDENNLSAIYQGPKWAIFKYLGGDSYHFEANKWARVQNII